MEEVTVPAHLFRFDKERVHKILWGIGVDSYSRFEAFLAHVHELSHPEFWYAFRHAWDGSDYLCRYKSIIQELLEDVWDEGEYMMSEEEWACFTCLPQRIRVIRGMTVQEFESRGFGASWTLQEEVAHFFAHTYTRNYSTNHLPRMVHSMEVDKEDVIAFFNERNEFEVLLHP